MNVNVNMVCFISYIILQYIQIICIYCILFNLNSSIFSDNFFLNYMQKNSLIFHVNLKLSSGLYIIIKLLIELTAHVKFRDSGKLVAGINWIITPSLIVNRCHN